VPPAGIEPATYGLQNRCSTVELQGRIGADGADGAEVSASSPWNSICFWAFSGGSLGPVTAAYGAIATGTVLELFPFAENSPHRHLQVEAASGKFEQGVNVYELVRSRTPLNVAVWCHSSQRRPGRAPDPVARIGRSLVGFRRGSHAMGSYRCHLSDHSRREVAFLQITCADDAAAIAIATRLLHKDLYATAELWHGSRFVSHLWHQPDPEAVAEAVRHISTVLDAQQFAARPAEGADR
jgi:hypothetical protein